MTTRRIRSCLLAALLLAPPAVRAEELAVPILVPLTGFLSLEGSSQRNGALLAFRQAPGGLAVRHDVADTGVSPEIAVNQLEKALEAKPVAIVASMLGTQMLAMLPIAAESKVPLITISGTAKITELDTSRPTTSPTWPWSGRTTKDRPTGLTSW